MCEVGPSAEQRRAARTGPAAASNASNAARDSGWRARLHLGFAHDGARTVLQERAHEGPLYVQRPFYPEDGVCHVYILHPPAGMVGGDILETALRVDPGASALITTPASAKVYRSAGPAASIRQTLTVAAGGTLEWLPQDTILFGGSRASIQTHIRLAGAARFMGWEVLSLGRPRSGDRYDDGDLRARTVIEVDGASRLIERHAWRAGDAMLAEPWGLGGKRVVAACHVYPACAGLLCAARELIATAGIDHCAATRIDDLLAVRALGDDATAMRDTLAAIWAGLRERALGRPGCAPRIWAT